MTFSKNFPAPTEELELKLVEYCMNVLNLEFGDFWYDWFPSRLIGNHNIQISSYSKVDEKILRETFLKYFDAVKIFSIQILDISNHVEIGEFTYLTIIHTKLTKE